ncbi:MAG TPA: biopolymer transporter ExbD [Candidatus Angelobacter sp.]
MAMTLGSRGGASSEINVTPMIDVLLVLLIIFMVVFPHKSTGEQALIPQRTNEPDPKVEETVVIQLKQAPDGQRASLSINKEQIGWDKVASRLQEIFSTRMNKVAFVKGDPEIEFQQIAEIIDITHHAGVTRVGLLGTDQ